MAAREYCYEVDATGHLRSASGYAWSPAGSMRLDGVHGTTWLGPFDACERDLLRVAASVLAADRLSPRRIAAGPRVRRDLSWQRTIQLRVAVEQPGRWTAAASQLAQLLTFMTDDAWDLHFDAAPRPAIQQLVPRTGFERPDEIALFSGGLDSVAGLYARSVATGAGFLTVSACGNDVRGSAQAAALAGLRRLGVKATGLSLVHQLRATHRRRSRMESSQRSRGLLFLAMGAVTASRLMKPTFNVYETGVGCANIPMSRAQVGAQGTRAMHPRTLDLFGRLLPAVIDRPVRALAPFFLSTKGELCRLSGSTADELARLTMSCDEGEGHKADAMEHCGVCTSCLFRRIALFSAGQSDPTRYRDRIMRRHGRYEQLIFESHANELLSCKTFSDLVEIDPNVRFASIAPLESPLAPPETELQILRMYHRYASEVMKFFEQARPSLARRSPAPRKESERDLFAAAG